MKKNISFHFEDYKTANFEDIIIPRIGERISFAEIINTNEERAKFSDKNVQLHVIDVFHCFNNGVQEIEIYLGDMKDHPAMINDFYSYLRNPNEY